MTKRAGNKRKSGSICTYKKNPKNKDEIACLTPLNTQRFQAHFISQHLKKGEAYTEESRAAFERAQDDPSILRDDVNHVAAFKLVFKKLDNIYDEMKKINKRQAADVATKKPKNDAPSSEEEEEENEDEDKAEDIQSSDEEEARSDDDKSDGGICAELAEKERRRQVNVARELRKLSK